MKGKIDPVRKTIVTVDIQTSIKIYNNITIYRVIVSRTICSTSEYMHTCDGATMETSYESMTAVVTTIARKSSYSKTKLQQSWKHEDVLWSKTDAMGSSTHYTKLSMQLGTKMLL